MSRARRDSALDAATAAERAGQWDEAMALRAGVAGAPIEVGEVGEAPWSRCDWSGQLVSLDGCPAHDFTIDDVAAVLGYGDTGGYWDGEAAGIARLKDGRYIVWESTWGPTGSGFSCDAYGGDADIAFAFSAGRALQYLSERSREVIRWA